MRLRLWVGSGTTKWIHTYGTWVRVPSLTQLCHSLREYSLGKTLMLGKIEGKRKRGQQRMRWLDGITDSVDMSLCPGSSVHGILQARILEWFAISFSRVICSITLKYWIFSSSSHVTISHHSFGTVSLPNSSAEASRSMRLYEEATFKEAIKVK